MLTTTMNPSSHQTPLRSPPFQARALHFFKKFALRTRGGRRSKDGLATAVALPSPDILRHSSVDLLRKPNSSLIGFRVDDHPMDADDASQDASASGNSSPLRRPRHLSAPIHTTFAGHGAAPLFFQDHASPGALLGNGNGNKPVNGHVLAPAPLFLRSNLSLDVDVQSPVSSPVIVQVMDDASEEHVHEEAVQDTHATTHPPGDLLAHHAPRTMPFPSLTPLVDRTPSTSTSSHSNLSRPQTAPAPEESTSEIMPKRPVLVPRYSAPLPPPFRLTTERGLRLSPSIVSRQPMPILNLPTLPPSPSPPADEDTPPPRGNAPLRSVPLLPRHGCGNADCEVDHEDATLEDSDEDDGDDGDDNDEELVDALSVHQSDDEDEELPSAGPSCIHGPKQKQRAMDDASPFDRPVATSPSPRDNNDVAGVNVAEYFNSKTCAGSVRLASLSEAHPFSPNIPGAGAVDQRGSLDPESPLSGEGQHLYRTASRSMINLGSTRRAPPKCREAVGSISGHTNETQTETTESGSEAIIGRRRRRTSMPSFHPTSDPPPYPTFDPRPRESRIMPPEDEEREHLPIYTNALYLIASMPRKMEFSSPGVQAKDRKWRRVVCELEGTAFRVYKCPPGASGAGVLGDWWEKRVGVGNVVSPNPPRTQKKEEHVERPAKLGIDEVPMAQSSSSSGRSTPALPTRQARPRTESQSSNSTRTSTPRPMKRISGASLLSPFRGSSTTRLEAGESSRRTGLRELEVLPMDAHGSRSSLLHESPGPATPATQRLSQPPQPRSVTRLTFLPVATGRAHWRSGDVPKPPKADLLRAYTLQHAESGLGNDYVKRKNVIRVRLEGEQFLLQAPDVPTVVEWIEGLHAGTNIALDIDQRPMPRGPLFPRRRRRRARRVLGDEQPAA